MKFLCDVHIPHSLVNYLKSLNFDGVHVTELSDKWYSTDKIIFSYADDSDRIVISKDSDFKNSFYIHGTPAKLIKINLGNIANNALIDIISQNLRQIEELYKSPHFIIEVDSESIYFSNYNDRNK